jgi:hypothetical protein
MVVTLDCFARMILWAGFPILYPKIRLHLRKFGIAQTRQLYIMQLYMTHLHHLCSHIAINRMSHGERTAFCF